MAFRSIGTLAGDVLRKAELAAHRRERAREFGDGPVTREEWDATGPLRRNEVVGGHSRATGMEGAEPEGQPRHIGRDVTTARPTSRLPRRSAVVISLAIYRERRHDLTAPW